ncbi:MAG: winged helix-turn-helix domain-containing protein, partial [Selenomonadaceae bacterium]|nr:winged helix-turn-helix domain-containing protein [Selenomonadaceae bacterium]
MNLKKTNPEIREYVKSRIIEFKEKGYAIKEIGELLNINDDYACQVLKKYRKMETIKSAIIKYTPDYFKLPYSLWSREAIQEFIKQKYGIEMPLTTITDYLRRWGMTCQRPAKRATKQSATAVKEFQEVTFPEIVSKAKKEGGMILFGDETGICNQEN